MFFIALGIFASIPVYGQLNKGLVMYPPPLKQGYRVPGLLSASATFTPGAMLNRDVNNYYLSGFAEYQLDRKLSLRSDNYFHLNSSTDPSYIDQAFRSYFGMFYHLNQSGYSNWDVKFGFQPGFTVMRLNSADSSPVMVPSDWVFAPSVSLSAGFDFYVWKYFHFFTNLAYVNSTMRGLPSGSQRTDELLFSAGLGFQIRTLK